MMDDKSFDDDKGDSNCFLTYFSTLLQVQHRIFNLSLVAM